MPFIIMVIIGISFWVTFKLIGFAIRLLWRCVLGAIKILLGFVFLACIARLLF
jgi:hypothetical protein